LKASLKFPKSYKQDKLVLVAMPLLEQIVLFVAMKVYDPPEIFYIVQYGSRLKKLYADRLKGVDTPGTNEYFCDFCCEETDQAIWLKLGSLRL
jgi:hypothetical protein